MKMIMEYNNYFKINLKMMMTFKCNKNQLLNRQLLKRTKIFNNLMISLSKQSINKMHNWEILSVTLNKLFNNNINNLNKSNMHLLIYFNIL